MSSTQSIRHRVARQARCKARSPAAAARSSERPSTRRHDSFGYFCDVQAPNYVQADTSLGLSGDDNNVQVTLPFAFTFYGQTFDTAWVCTNGFVTFENPGGPGCPFFNSGIPGGPSGSIFPFWDDMFLDGASSTWTKVIGSAPDRQFVIEWRNATFF